MTSDSALDVARAARATLLRAELERAFRGSTTRLLGSLASGTADGLSDIDLAWHTGERGHQALTALPRILRRVGPVASLRTDLDSAPDPSRRLVFVRFENWPVFSRVDLEIHGQVGSATVGTGSLCESALMNAVAAIKARRRRRPDVDGLLARGFARIGADDPGGTWDARVHALVDAAAAREPALVPLGNAIRAEIS